MRTDRLRQVADRIELEDRFDYATWVSGLPSNSDWFNNSTANAARQLSQCGTTGCVAGWAAHLALLEGHQDSGSGRCMGIPRIAAEWLELTTAQADRLFMGDVASEWLGEDDPDDGAWEAMTAVEAAKMLRQIADGELEL